jgi:hypothetical protein
MLASTMSGRPWVAYARGLNSMELLNENEKRRFWFILLNEFLHMQLVLKLRELNMIEAVDYDAFPTLVF